MLYDTHSKTTASMRTDRGTPVITIESSSSDDESTDAAEVKVLPPAVCVDAPTADECSKERLKELLCEWAPVQDSTQHRSWRVTAWTDEDAVIRELGLGHACTPANGHCQMYAVVESLMNTPMLDMKAEGRQRAAFYEIVRFLRPSMLYEFLGDQDRETRESQITGEQRDLEKTSTPRKKRDHLLAKYEALSRESSDLDSTLDKKTVGRAGRAPALILHSGQRHLRDLEG